MDEVTLQSLQESIKCLMNSMNSMNAKLEESEERTQMRFEILLNKLGGNHLNIETDFAMQSMEKQDSHERLQLPQQQVVNEVFSSVSDDQVKKADLENISYDCQINKDISSFEENADNTSVEYDEYEEIIFNSEFTSEVVTENINILSENSYLEEKNLSQILSVINYYNYHYIKHSSFFKVIYYYHYDYYYGDTFVASFIKDETDANNLIKFILSRKVFDPGTIYNYFVYWNATVKWF